MVASVTVREPEFSPGDVDAMLETRALERRPRGAHGFLLSESMDPANQFRFRPVGPRTDWAAKAMHDAEEQYRKDNPKTDVSSQRWGVELL